MPSHKNPFPGDHKIYNLDRPFTAMDIVCVNHAWPRSRKEDFYKKYNKSE